MSDNKSAQETVKAAIWIGILTTVGVCAAGWLGALAWVIARGGPGALVEHTTAIFAVAAASLVCAVVASISAGVALRWQAPRAAGADAAETEAEAEATARRIESSMVPAHASGGSTN